MARALMNWHRAAKERSRLKKSSGPGPTSPAPNTPGCGWSPVHLLHKYRPNDLESVATTSSISYPSPCDTDLSEFDRSTHTRHDEPERINPDTPDGEFTFDRP